MLAMSQVLPDTIHKSDMLFHGAAAIKQTAVSEYDASGAFSQSALHIMPTSFTPGYIVFDRKKGLHHGLAY